MKSAEAIRDYINRCEQANREAGKVIWDTAFWYEQLERLEEVERTEAAEKAIEAAEKAEAEKAATIAARDARDVTAAATHSHEAATAAATASKAALEAYHMSGNRTDTPEYIAAAEADNRANEAASIAIRAFYETAEAAELASEAAAEALMDAYADVIGEYPADDSPESIAIDHVAVSEVMETMNATAEELGLVADIVEAIARSARRPDLTKYATVKYLVFDDDAEPEPEPYQRAELLAYLGEPDDYDVTAIEHDATAYDPATGRTVWAVDAETLAAIAERHQLQFYAPAF